MRICILIALASLVQVALAAKLGSYNVDKSKITVSGISAGGAMAVQLHAAFSATFSGAGIVTGPPYYCAQGSVNTATTTCMNGLPGVYSAANAQTKLASYVTAGTADSTNNLKNSRVYNYHGTSDFTVVTAVSKKNEDFYSTYGANMKTVYTYASAHGFITNNYGTACGTTNSQAYINNCNYNQAYDLLNHINGGLDKPEPPKDQKAKEALIEFDQKEFYSSTTSSLDSIGYVYVPKNCANGKTCKLHVALHGCLQGRYKIGTVFAENAGYNPVADDNDIIILYPQAVSAVLSNPNGCFDWWGYADANYANKKGVQMAAIKAMIDRLTSGTTVVNPDPITTTTATTPVQTTAPVTPNPDGGNTNTTVACTCRLKNDPNGQPFYLEF